MATTSLLACIVEAVCKEWSGRLDVRIEGKSLGHVVMAGGKVAWAKCNDQTENLASLLWRLSHITSEQLNEVSKLYYKYQGKRRIGAILEEHGIMSRPVLRRCLMLHIRFALTSLFAYPDALVDLVPEAIALDETILFNPEEVLPFPLATDFAREWIDKNQEPGYWQRISAESSVLKPLQQLPSYKASAVVSSHGSVLVAHSAQSPLQAQAQVLGVLLASLAEAGNDLTRVMGLGQVDAATLECTEGLLSTRWIDAEHNFLVVVLAAAGAAGEASSHLRELCGTLSAWLERAGERDEAQGQAG